MHLVIMESRAFCLLMFYWIFNVCSLQFGRPSNGLRECRKNSSLTALEVLPGGGWDNLRNIDMGRVMNLSYSQCQTTEDGVYLIPDEVFVVPKKVSGVETHSEIIMTWLEQTSCTSSSINAEASYSSVVNGKFSNENQRMKTHQVKGNSVTARVQVRNHLYTVQAQPDFALDSHFANQAVEIANAIQNNQTRLATYLSEKLILDYGTHVITSIDAGATLAQEDYLKTSYVSNISDMSSLLASAGANFFSKVKFEIIGKDSHKTSETSEYEGNITHSIIQSHGGASFYPGITLEKWQESAFNNLVAVDRSGLPLHYFLNPSAFPDFPVLTINTLALLVRQAAERYYNINTNPGCVNPNSKYFNFQANVDDLSCDGPVTNLSFGGIYQKCAPLTADGNVICDELAQKNPATGDYSCDPLYTATLLRSETLESGYQECHRSCHSCNLVNQCCNEICTNNIRCAKLDTYWCSTNQKTPETSRYLFGGLFGPSFQNPLTKSNSCPPNYFALKFLSSGTMVCLSNDYEAGTRFSVPFAGFFSCQSGNPLANGESCCPPQFSQHIAAISDGCEVLYCVQSDVFTGGPLTPVRLPPFTRQPLVSMIATNTVAIITEGDRSWVRAGETKVWRLAKPGEINQIISGHDGSSSQMSTSEKAGVVIGVMACIALLVAVTAFLVKKRRSFFGPRISMEYEEAQRVFRNESVEES